MTRFCFLAVLVGVASAASVSAQPTGVQGRPLVCHDLPDDGPDPRETGLGSALAAAERYDLDVDALGYTLAWAARERDPQHISILKEIVEAYRCGAGNAAVALQAIAAAGEPADYFLAYLADGARDDVLAYHAAGALGSRLDPDVVAPMEAIIAAYPDSIFFRGPRNRMVGEAVRHAGHNLSLDSLWRRQLSTLDHIRRLVPAYGPLAGGFVGDRFVLAETDPWGNGSAYRAAQRTALWNYARTHPSAVQQAIDEVPQRLAPSMTDQRDWSPAEQEAAAAAAVEATTATAFPSTAPPLPPVGSPEALTVLACRDVVAFPSPGTAFAVFAYASSAPSAFRLTYGPANRIENESGDELPFIAPEVFYPDGEGPWRARLVRVPLPEGDAVTWHVGDQSVTVDASSVPCTSAGEPLGVASAPMCDGLTATVYVSPEGRVVGGPDDGQPYAGTLRGTNGDDVIVGTDGSDVLRGRQGDDTLCGLGGDAELRGDNGNDALWGGAGDDRLLAGSGDDRAYGEAGDDTARGAAGADALWGGPGADELDGNAGDDLLWGGDGDDALEGGTEDDVLRGEGGTDEARGGAGTDACEAETELSCETDPADEDATDG